MTAKQLAPYEEYFKNKSDLASTKCKRGRMEISWRYADGKQEDDFDQYGIADFGEKGKYQNIV